MEQLIDFFQEKEVKQVLDVGTGTGDFIPILKKVFSKADITGIDPNSESFEIAGINHPEVTFLKMTAERLDFPNNLFDVVSISMALHHLPDVQISLNEIQRVVKQNGWIIISELVGDNLDPAQEVHKLYHHFRSRIDRLLGISHRNTFKKEEILKAVKDSGIRILLHFDFESEIAPVRNPDELNERMKKMQIHLDKIKGAPEYKALQPHINRFRELSAEHGIRMPAKVIIIGRAK